MANPTIRLQLCPHTDKQSGSHHPGFPFVPIQTELRPGTIVRIGRSLGKRSDKEKAGDHRRRQKEMSNNVSVEAETREGVVDFINFGSTVVSREHAELRVDMDGQVFITDMGSSGGTLLNGLRLSSSEKESKRHLLTNGDVLQFGVDYRGGEEERYKRVVARVTLHRVQTLNVNAQWNILIPDILIVVFAHHAVSISDLLTFERVCKQWCAIIRTNQIQIWKSKLVQAYPAGCCPVLYGQENWRDVATLWWAWNRPWKSQLVGPPQAKSVTSVVEEVPSTKTLERRSDEFVQDLIDYQYCSSGMGSQPQGGRPDGLVIMKHPHLNNHLNVFHTPTPDIHWHKKAIDVLFAPTNAVARGTDRNIRPGAYRRTKFVMRLPYGAKNIIGEDSEKDGVVIQLPASTEIQAICGNNLMYRTDQRDVKLLSLNDTFPSLTVPPLTAMNETLRASFFPTNGSDGYLAVFRLSDNSEIARYQPLRVLGISMTRFNVIVQVSNEWCLIFDMHLNKLTTFPTQWREKWWKQCTHSIRWRISEWHPGAEDSCGDWMTFFHCDSPMADDMVVFDPKTRKYRRYVREERSPEIEVLEGRYCRWWWGYWVVTMEYPTDKEGRRTGAGGQTKVYWRCL
ncbi:hypothetical protein HDV00_006196 [Rhizophlyctis rosea]|nr:hypothetical protein HDV00_006196 [Rhizophlyctis rosea]